MNICVVSDVNISLPLGNTIKVVSFASELKKRGFDVTLVAVKPPEASPIEELGDMVTYSVPPIGGSIINHLRKVRMLVRKVKEIQKDNKAFLHIETSVLGGYFALAGFSNYVLGIHGIVSDEEKYTKLPWYIPRGLYRKYIYFLEKMAVKRASKVIAVSNPMKEYIVKEWKVPEEKVAVIPNGYFAQKIKRLENARETKGMISFAGVIARWALVDKVIEAARALRDEKASFYIIGSGKDRDRIEQMIKNYNLDNVILTGLVPIDRSYEILAESEIVLAPFPKVLALEVACPIKLLEYMALGKAMVIDDVSEIATMLKENDAALVSDPLDQDDFINNIRVLLSDEQLRKRIASNARKLAGDFSWEKQGKKLAMIYDGVQMNNQQFDGIAEKV